MGSSWTPCATRIGTRRKFPPYEGYTLVPGNVSFNNGGSGMHAFLSDHVHFEGNIAWHNARVVKDGCEMFGMDCKDVLVLNNVIVPRAGPRANSNRSWHGPNVGLFYDYNVYFNTTNVAVRGPHDQFVDPLFVTPSTNAAVADFRFQPGSPVPQNGFPGIEEWKRVELPRLQSAAEK